MSIRGCLIKNASALTTQNFGTEAALQWDTTVSDSNGLHAGTDGKITITSALNGRYGIFTACLSFANLGGTIYTRVILKKNGSVFNGSAGADRILANGNGQSANAMWVSFVSPPILLTTGDFFEVFFFCNDGSMDIKAESTFGLHVIDNTHINQRCLATVNGDKTTQNFSTPTAIVWDGTDTYDTDAIHDPASNNDSLIIPSALNGKNGVVYAAVLASLVANDQSMSLAITKGGSLTYTGFAGNSGEQGATGSFALVAQTQPILFSTGDVFKALLYSQDTSVTLTGSDTSRTTFGLWALD